MVKKLISWDKNGKVKQITFDNIVTFVDNVKKDNKEFFKRSLYFGANERLNIDGAELSFITNGLAADILEKYGFAYIVSKENKTKIFNLFSQHVLIDILPTDIHIDVVLDDELNQNVGTMFVDAILRYQSISTQSIAKYIYEQYIEERLTEVSQYNAMIKSENKGK